MSGFLISFDFIVLFKVIKMKQVKEDVQQNSLEWNQTIYMLQLMTGQSTLKMINLYKYSQNPPNPLFEYKSKVDALVEITDFKREYKEKIFTKTIPIEDVIFFCGHVNLKTYNTRNSKIFSYLICEVVLGRIGSFQDSQNESDSIYIPAQKDSNPFHYNYLVRDHHQYDVKYEVSFKIGDEDEFNTQEIICSICQKYRATLYCKQEKMHFCDDCGRNHHIQFNQTKSKTKIIHQLQKINRINALPLCPQHSIKNQYFCLKCQKYICNICIQKATHNQNSDHIIKPIEYLYQEMSQNNDLLPAKHQQKLKRLIKNVSGRSKEITDNYELVKKKLIDQFDRAIFKLDKLYKDKVIRIRSDQIQLNMISQKIQWSKAFIKHQQKLLKPIFYFKLQARYQKQIQNIKINNFQSAFVIEPDLDCYAKIIVGKREEVEAAVANLSANQNSNYFEKKVMPIQTPQSSKFNSPTNNRADHSILIYDPKREPPKYGQLGLQIQNSNLHFFRVVSTKHKKI